MNMNTTHQRPNPVGKYGTKISMSEQSAHNAANVYLFVVTGQFLKTISSSSCVWNIKSLRITIFKPL